MKSLLMILLIALLPFRLFAVTDEDVDRKITLIIKSLKDAQAADGSWSYGGYSVGGTALVVMALLHAEVSPQDPAVQKGINFILNNSDGKTYSEGLVPNALELAGAANYMDRIRKSLDFLVSAQTERGDWTYTDVKGARRSGDNSNTQFAALGLASCERAGLTIPAQTRKRAVDFWYGVSAETGGWGYSGTSRATMPMTCAGIASLYLLGEELEKHGRNCGDYEYNKTLNKAMAKLNEFMKGGQAPGSHKNYALYALERVGIFLNLKEIGGVDWYRFGVEQLVGGNGNQFAALRNSNSDKALELLFLAKGNAPIAIAKWQWDGDWNVMHQDVANWVKLGSEELGAKLDWLSADVKRPNSPAAKASLLFISGRNRFQVSDKELQFIRAFLAGDGVLVAEGCCDDPTFPASFNQEIIRKLYPNQKLKFVKVQDKHPMCSAVHRISASQTGAFELKGGCSPKKVILLTKDISPTLAGRPENRVEQVRSKKVAINLLAWAVGAKPPEKKLDQQILVLDGKSSKPMEDLVEMQTVGSNLLQPLGRLKFDRQHPVCTGFYSHLRKLLAPYDKLPKFDGELLVEASSPELFHSAALFIVGSEVPRLRPEGIANLRTYVQTGGSILASGCSCGENFDQGFREMVSLVFPNDELEEIPRDDVLWTQPYRIEDKPVNATQAYTILHGKKWAPLYGIKREGRWVLIYSPVDLCCGFEEELSEGAVAYRKENAFPIIANAVHYFVAP